MHFLVIIKIYATDPENASAISDAKAETACHVFGEEKQFQVVEVLESKYQLVNSTRNS